MELSGYNRSDGRIGFRNHVIVIPLTGCQTEVARRIASSVPGATCLGHVNGCDLQGADSELLGVILEHFATHPNVGGVLFLAMGCAATLSLQLPRKVKESGRSVETLNTQNAGTTGTVEAGIRIVRETVLFPGHDYEGRGESTVGAERSQNPWLQLSERDEFAEALAANPPPRPANMDQLLRLNREGVENPEEISAADAARLVAAGGATSTVDVRTGAEFEGQHIPGSRLIPLDQVESRADEVRAVPAPRLLLCQSGNRAGKARDALRKLHVAGLTVIAGGIGAYVEAGGEVVKGKARMSLERQVRIAAGSLVLLGTLMGFVAHGAFLILSGLVGAGLIFAGITDWCGMGLLLSRMPWNRASGDGEAPAAGGTCAASAPGACAAGAPPSGGCAAEPPAKEDDDSQHE